ncbi:hypothetical protein AMTRI_Chr12g237140 [Amborella trichopoda]|uniref:uncharacterized protein LOC18438510 isoform X2 n=1 Tax=Amborella trichopoda TaxID=13333 RepID=UPI0009C101E1|nr:uncharacterized protein LOC18438510 isoform X2 [Amborella trichopoda]|eukprot:XP_020525715.1 uncharacterized protein LOC18438510 isoform X2 [Amborella trichopoda]
MPYSHNHLSLLLIKWKQYFFFKLEATQICSFRGWVCWDVCGLASFAGPDIVVGKDHIGFSLRRKIEQSARELSLCIDIYDELGIGGGASGVAGGLLHPYSPKAKLLWKGAQCWEEAMVMLSIAEAAKDEGSFAQDLKDLVSQHIFDGPIVWKRGIIKPITAMKSIDIMKKNIQDCLPSCPLELLDSFAIQKILPGLSAPSGFAIYMPKAVNVHPERYLQALFLACNKLVKDLSAVGYSGKQVNFYKQTVHSLQEISGEYSAVVICLGARSESLPELKGVLPLRMCRGVVAHLDLPGNMSGGEYKDSDPSILADAWLAVRGPRSLAMGSTWQWGSRNYSRTLSSDEESSAMHELLSKASILYPDIRNWSCESASAGLRAMPPLTTLGSLPLLGSVDNLVGHNSGGGGRYWFMGGLGARGLLYHGWLGKLMAQAVLSCSAAEIPFELTTWKNRM